MKLHLQKSSSLCHVTECALHGERFRIKIGSALYRQSIIISSQTVQLWPVEHVSDLCKSHFEDLALLDTELILLGTGRTLCFPETGMTEPLMLKRIGLEVMDTAAACRTFNLLQSDSRKVSAALLI